MATPSYSARRLQNASQGMNIQAKALVRKSADRRDQGQTKKALDCGLDGKPPVSVACMGAATPTVLVGAPHTKKKCMGWESSAYERSFGDLTSRELHHVCAWLIGASDTPRCNIQLVSTRTSRFQIFSPLSIRRLVLPGRYLCRYMYLYVLIVRPCKLRVWSWRLFFCASHPTNSWCSRSKYDELMQYYR